MRKRNRRKVEVDKRESRKDFKKIRTKARDKGIPDSLSPGLGTTRLCAWLHRNISINV